MNVMEAIKSRSSIRGYEDKALSQAQIDTLVEAALASPTACDGQNWHFTFSTDKELHKAVNDAASQAAPKPFSDIFYNAPLVVFISQLEPTKGNMGSDYGPVDAGIAVENLALAAVELGLGSVILGLPRLGLWEAKFAGDLNERLQFPTGYKFQIAIAIGYPATTKEQHEPKDGRISFL